MKRTSLSCPLFAILVGFASTPVANAAIIFSEDFEDFTLTPNPLPLTTSTAGSSFTSNVTTDTTAPIQSLVHARTSTTDYFGSGTANTFLHLVDGSDVTAGVRGPLLATSSPLVHLSFDFFDPLAEETPFGQEAGAGTRFYLNPSNGGGGSSSAIDFHLQNGTIRHTTSGSTSVGNYEQGEAHRFDVIANFSDEAINYYFGGDRSVASKSYDIYVNGVLKTLGSNDTDDLAFRNTAATTVTHFGISGVGNASISEGYIDNILISDSVRPSPIPEPSSMLLVLLGLSLALGVRRRTRCNPACCE